MKNKIIIFLAFISLLLVYSCEDYLDVDSGSLGLYEDEIFSEFQEYQDFLNAVYENLSRSYNGRTTGKAAISSYVAGRCFPMTVGDQMRSQDKSANEDLLLDVGFVESQYKATMWDRLWTAIRYTNIAIANHHYLVDATEEEKNGLIGQAYMGRALAYQFLLELWGGMPYLTKPVTADQMDFARETYYHTCQKIALDCDSAAMYLPARWDVGPSVTDDGYADSYSASSDTRRFTSVLALAVKSRTLLYAASPFAQDSKTAEDANSTQQDWEAAAIAASEAINAAENNLYLMLPFDKIHENFYGVVNGGESLWSIMDGMNNHQHAASGLFGQFTTPFALTQRTSEEQCAVFATNDIAERFEAVKYNSSGTIVSAKPIVTYDANGNRFYHGTDADMATYYNEQNPYNNPKDISPAKPSPVYPGQDGFGRDPRFYKFMTYHGRAIDRWGKAGTTWDEVLNQYGGGHLWENFTGDRSMARRFDMSVGSYDLKQIKSPTYDNTTGYFTGKFWDLGVNNILGAYTRMQHPYPIYRVAELYLNYAEAANQAYGGSTGTAPGARYSAADALNKVRNRSNMPDVDMATYNTVDAFHDRVFNERSVELCFETNHSFVDVRRWKLIGTEDYREVYAMKITLDVSGDTDKYPTGYVYTPELLEVKPYDPKYLLCPVIKYDVDRSVLFEQNPGY